MATTQTGKFDGTPITEVKWELSRPISDATLSINNGLREMIPLFRQESNFSRKAILGRPGYTFGITTSVGRYFVSLSQHRIADILSTMSKDDTQRALYDLPGDTLMEVKQYRGDALVSKALFTTGQGDIEFREYSDPRCALTDEDMKGAVALRDAGMKRYMLNEVADRLYEVTSSI
jgi:hypothetical protein